MKNKIVTIPPHGRTHCLDINSASCSFNDSML